MKRHLTGVTKVTSFQAMIFHAIPLPFCFSPRALGRGGGTSQCQVCATNQGRFFTSKNPEQTPNFELFLEQALIFKVLYQNRILF